MHESLGTGYHAVDGMSIGILSSTQYQRELKPVLLSLPYRCHRLHEGVPLDLLSVSGLEALMLHMIRVDQDRIAFSTSQQI